MKKNYFNYTVKHFKVWSPINDNDEVPKSMEKEVRISIKMDRLLYDDDSDWEIAEEWEHSIFYKTAELSPDMNKIRKIKKVNKYES